MIKIGYYDRLTDKEIDKLSGEGQKLGLAKSAEKER